MAGAGDANLHPTAGVRLLLEHVSDDAAGAIYDGAVYTPAARLAYRVSVRLPGGEVTLAPIGDAAGPGQDGAAATSAELLRAQARVLARQALATTPPTWPRRLLRWRETR